MPSSSVVPRVAGFLSNILESLKNLDFQVWIRLFEKGAKGCAHYAAADQDDVEILCFHRKSLTSLGRGIV
jgi:hypothetical protein